MLLAESPPVLRRRSNNKMARLLLKSKLGFYSSKHNQDMATGGWPSPALAPSAISVQQLITCTTAALLHVAQNHSQGIIVLLFVSFSCAVTLMSDRCCFGHQ